MRVTWIATMMEWAASDRHGCRFDIEAAGEPTRAQGPVERSFSDLFSSIGD